MYSERSNGSGSAGGARVRGKQAAKPLHRQPFLLYVEGPGDCDILRSWSRRISRSLERVIAEASVILGGRQPARAVAHFRRARETDSSARGLCILDRDHSAEPIDFSEDGLEFFTWPQRHIESYLLVPDAIRRHAGGDHDPAFVERLLAKARSDEPSGGRGAAGGVDAKRLLGPRGPLARQLGAAISPPGIAREMRRDEIHAEVHELLGRVSEAAGLYSRIEPARRTARDVPSGD